MFRGGVGMSLRDDKRGHVKIENGMAVIYVPADEIHGISRQAPYPARVVRLPGFCGHPCPGARPAHCAGHVSKSVIADLPLTSC